MMENFNVAAAAGYLIAYCMLDRIKIEADEAGMNCHYHHC